MKEDRCCRCTHFQRFYTMGLRKFNRTKIGRCCKCDEIVNALDTCVNWEIDTRKLSTNYGLKFSLHDLMVKLSTIRQLVEEYEKDEKL